MSLVTLFFRLLLTAAVLALWLLIVHTLAAPVTSSHERAAGEGSRLVWVPGHTPEIRSSRTRPLTARRSGTLLSTTCYLATGRRTASGVWPRRGLAASNRFPFGTRLYVQNSGTFTVVDRIGAHSDLDLFFTDRAACLRFGRQHLLVQVVR